MSELPPMVSVIIPARNEGRYIGPALESLLRCSYPPERWEILIADGMSTDNTRDEIARVAKESPVPIRVFENTRRVTPTALNVALAHTRGEIIIRVDAHAAYGEEYVTRCVEAAQASGAANVGGPVLTRPGGEGTVARAIAFALAHPLGVGNSAFRTSREACEVDTVPFGCFRAEYFRRLGLFDERLLRNQDYEMNQRIRRSGGRIFLDPRLESTYYSRGTFRGLWQQAWANGFWNALTHYLHPYSFCPRHALPGLFALGVLVSALLALWAGVGGMPAWLRPFSWGVWGGYLLYAAVCLGVATGLARREGWRYWPVLLAVFPSLHFTYGGGIVWGWVRALTHWHPWAPTDGIPRWEDRHQEEESSQLAA